MSTLLWKEFRENLKWGVVLLIISFLYQLGSQFISPYEQVLLYSNFESMLGLGCAIAATILGLLQTFREVSRDRWAYLMHRGVTPQQILRAKAIVGISLYLVAGLVPLGILCVWAAIPGNVAAPWHPLIPVRPFLTILSLAPFWFVGVLISLRDVRWYGTRLMVFGLPAVLGIFSVALLSSSYFIGILCSLVPTVINMALMLILTSNSVERRGQYGQLATPSRCILALNISISIAAAMMFVLGLGSQLARPYLAEGPKVNVRTTILEDGALEEVTVDNLTQKIIARKINGQSVAVSETHEPEFLTWRKYPEWIPGGDLYGMQPWLPAPMHLMDQQLQCVWHYLPEQGVFQGYHRQTRRHMHTISPEGVLPASQTPQQRFDRLTASTVDYGVEIATRDKDNKRDPVTPPLRSDTVYAFRDGVFYIHAESGEVRKIYSAPPDDPLTGVRITESVPSQQVYEYEKPPADSPRAPLLAEFQHKKTVRQFVIKAEDEKRIASQPLHEQLFAPLEQQAFVMPKGLDTSLYSQFLGFRKGTHALYVFVDASTDIAMYHMLYAKADGAVQRHVVTNSLAVEVLSGIFPVVVPPGMVVTALTEGRINQIDTSQVAAEDFAVHPALTTVHRLLIAGVISALIGLGLSVDRKVSRNSLIAWTLFCALMGVSGLLALIGLVPRPLRVKCHQCGKLRAVDQPHCPQCHAEFEPPPQNGTEIIIREPELVPATVE